MNATREEFDTISKIANRAIKLGINKESDKLSMVMDIDYTNKVIPLDLEGLLHSTLQDFIHDIIGIYNNFNRETLQMDNFFVPRYAK